MKRKNKVLSSWETLTVPFIGLEEVHDGDDLLDLGELQENEFRGMASVFGMVIDAHTPTIMQRGAFTKTLQERSRSLPILWQHDMDEPIGKPTRLFENDNGLVLQAHISRTARGRDALTLMRDGVVGALSIGFEPVIWDFQEQSDKSAIRFIREARLIEISVVTLGADPNALITEVRSGQVAGKLERYVASSETEESTTEETLTSLVEEFQAFVAAVREEDSETPDHVIVENFAATLHKAGPVVEPPTLVTDVEHQLQMAELLAAQMILDQL